MNLKKVRPKRHGCAQMLRFRRLGTVVAMILIKKEPPVLQKNILPQFEHARLSSEEAPVQKKKKAEVARSK
jgi:hypothetical protein